MHAIPPLRRLFPAAAVFAVAIAFAVGVRAGEIKWDLMRTYTYLDLAEFLETCREREYFEFMYKYTHIERTPQHKFMLGLLYHHGLGVERDYAKAARWYREAAEGGYEFRPNLGEEAAKALESLIADGLYDPAARAAPPPPTAGELAAAAGTARDKLRMGIRLHYGICADLDYDKARAWQIWAAESGDPDAVEMVGNNYLYGECGYPRDEARGKEWLSGTRKKDPGFTPPVSDSAVRDAVKAPAGGILAEVAELARRRRSAGDDAESASGEGPPVVAESGAGQPLGEYAHQIFRVGLYHYQKTKDYYLAALNFTEAAAFGLEEPECHYLLGKIQEEGLCGEPNPYGAGKSYRIAADMGHAEAMMRLADLHRDGRGVRRSASEAARWYAAARDAGAAGAAEALGRAEKSLGEGDGAWPPEMRRVVADAQLRAFFNFSPFMLAEEMKRSAGWLVKAAESGQPYAQFLLGRAYEKGDPRLDLPRDPALAAEWLEKARRAGVTEADAVRFRK